MKKSQYRVWNLDVWGNLEEGYWVNDRSKIGTVELSEEAEKPEILQALYEEGLIFNPEKIDLSQIEIIDNYPDFGLDYEGKPYFQLTSEEKG